MANNNHDVNNILQVCLEAIQRGDETVASVLARYPEYADELRPQLEAANWLIKSRDSFDPRPEFVSASRQRLMAQINQGVVAPAPTPAAAAPAAAPRPSFWEMLLNFARSPQAMRLAMALLLIAFVLFGSGRAVLAAEKALPGDRLYPVKITYENIQVLVSLSESRDARLHTQFAQRRLLELEELIMENRFEYVEDTVEAYERQVERAIVALRQVAGQDAAQAEQIATDLEQVLTEQTVVLAILSALAPQDTRAHLQRAMDVSQAGVITVNEIRLTAIAQTTATPTPTFTFTLTPSDTATGLMIAAATQTASPSPSATISVTRTISGTLVVSGTTAAGGDVTSTPGPTNTRVPGTGPTATATRTPKPTDDVPSAGTATFTATSPPPPHTATATQPGVTPPTSTTEPVPTQTSPVAPSPTWTPSPTPVTPSPTPVPPSPTPVTPVPTTPPPPPPPTETPLPVCEARASIDGPTGNKIDLRIQNIGDTPITLSRVTIDWPLSNEELRAAEMAGSTIWTGLENSTPTTIDNWSGSAEARTIPVGTFKNLRLTFKRAAESSGYNAALNFEQGCSATASR
jgi:hypothetical protein